jgi:thiamine pyrophosphate-dependent acetolactate synthase large subunit-like protein
VYGHEIIQELASFLTGEELIVGSNGNISRQIYHYLPRPQVYLRGSMGLPVSVGLGLALARPERKVLVILGDGNLLMGLSSLVTASFARSENLRILILDNQAYATTGRQKTTSGVLRYPALFDGFGMKCLKQLEQDTPIAVVRARMRNWLDATELTVLPVLVDAKPPRLENIPLHPEEITRALWNSLSETRP